MLALVDPVVEADDRRGVSLLEREPTEDLKLLKRAPQLVLEVRGPDLEAGDLSSAQRTPEPWSSAVRFSSQARSSCGSTSPGTPVASGCSDNGASSGTKEMRSAGVTSSTTARSTSSSTVAGDSPAGRERRHAFQAMARARRYEVAARPPAGRARPSPGLGQGPGRSLG